MRDVSGKQKTGDTGRVSGRLHLGGLQWVGRDPRGVSKWRGAWRTIPRWFCTLFKGLGIGLVCLACLLAAFGIWEAAPALLFAGTVHTILGFVFLDRMRNRLDGLITEQEAAEHLGVSVDEVRSAVEAEGIRPTYILNDAPLFALDAFGDSGLLLRSSSAPVDDATLLRPAAGHAAGTAELLLRPTAASSDESYAAVPQAENQQVQTVSQTGSPVA